ncbi:MAG: chemotaxis protein histidine kinase CheA [Bacteriovoracaceae bacterium]|jgi:chemotaxis protein histidine kinase CheA
MSMLQDPEMAEIIEDFCKESEAIYNDLESMLEDYEDNQDSKKLEEFGQVIDRVMGAAKSVDADQTGLYCDLGKTISYKASQSMDKALLDIVVAVLFDTVEILQVMNKTIASDKIEKVSGINLEAFGTRLRWLADKFKDIQRSSVSIGTDDTKLDDQKSIDDLLADLGL